MTIFFFLIGLVVGFLCKLGVDEYVNWQEIQKKTYLDMENILINFRAIEKIKELDK